MTEPGNELVEESELQNMSQEELKVIIESEASWDLAKHRSASLLLEHYDSEYIRNYIWNLFLVTKDYYYCSILKGK